VGILVTALVLLAIRNAIVHNVSFSTLVLATTAFVLSALFQISRVRKIWLWTTVTFLVSGTIMVVTSGNGFKQIHGAAMLAAVFYYALLTTATPPGSSSVGGRRSIARVFGTGLLVSFATLFLGNPYHDARLWDQRAVVNAAPAFRMIRMTPNKARAITLLRKALAGVPAHSRLMVLGAHPWIYFAADALPDSDMIFMHFTGGARAYQILASRLQNRHPAVVVLSGPTSDAILAAADRVVKREELHCEKTATDPMLIGAALNIQTFYDMLPTLFVCKAREGGAASG